MGRRKIEIQPITNERNRSVTFLKRKNGLFKKAHELGVLCSVDVAVIIFDERHGHDTKLFQYCSADIREIIQRHLRHHGEKDTRGPTDFSDNPGARNDGGGGDMDDDEDDGDADDLEVATAASKRGSKAKDDDDDYVPSTTSEPKLRPSTQKDKLVTSDRHHHQQQQRSSVALSPFPPIPPPQAQTQYGNQHPVSSDRLYPIHHQRPYLHDQLQNKKPRLEGAFRPDDGPAHGGGGHHHHHQQLPLSSSTSTSQNNNNRGFGEDPMYAYHNPESQAYRHTQQHVPPPSAPSPHNHDDGGGRGRPQHLLHYPYDMAYTSSAPMINQHQGYAAFNAPPPPSDYPLGPVQVPAWQRTNGPGVVGGGGLFYTPSVGGAVYDDHHRELPQAAGRSFSRRRGEDDDGGDGDSGGGGRPGSRSGGVRGGGHPSNEKEDIGREETFANAFLEAEQQRRVHDGLSAISSQARIQDAGILPPISRGGSRSSSRSAATTAASFGLDWPTHRVQQQQVQQTVNTPSDVKPSLSPSASSSAVLQLDNNTNNNGAKEKNNGALENDPGTATPSGSGDVGWLDLLSGAAPVTNDPLSTAGTPRPGSSAGV